MMLANFHATMKTLLDYNMCIEILTNFTSKQLSLPFPQLSKWLKFIELSMAMIVGNSKDERCFKYLKVYEKQIKEYVDRPFGFGC
jgi:hypothetical protein